MRADGNGDWSRFWLHSKDPEGLALAASVGDPQPQPWGYWRGGPCTFACEVAITRAIGLARQYKMDSVPAGLLAYSLILDPANSAAQALGITTREGHEQLLSLAQLDLIGAQLPERPLPKPAQPVPAKARGGAELPGDK